MNDFCPFCKEFETGKKEIKDKKGKIELKRIIYSTENFVVFPSLGQIVEGYLLISPKKHYISLAQMPNSFYDELTNLQEKVKEILTKNYSKPIFFEHGPFSRKEKAGCCIEHAHLHAVPTNVSILEEVVEHFPAKIIKSFSELPSNSSYLFLEENNEKYFCSINTVLPPQYLRQILAVKLGVPEKWDWREYLRIKELQNTIKRLNSQAINPTNHTFVNQPY